MTLLQNKPHAVEVWLSELGLPSADRNYLPGHERVQNLITSVEQVGFTLTKPKFRIRVAGTNGKGSTAQFLAESLQAVGFKVGLYTSPHIMHFHERIRVQGVAIADDDLISLMEKLMPLALQAKASYFEVATVLALMYFSMQHVDIEILEAGVGAKLDATTAVPADMGILTPVALDHQDWLGDNLTCITQEKSYIFKNCLFRLSAQQETSVSSILDKKYRDIQYTEYFTYPLLMQGQHQKQNAGLAWQAVQVLQQQHPLFSGIDLNESRQAIQQASVLGRLQHIPFQKHNFWLDAAHNEHAIHALLPSLAEFERPFDFILLCTREDRDLSQCVPKLKPFTRKLIVMTGDTDYTYKSVSEALTSETAVLEAGRVLVLGSFITLGEAIRWMNSCT